MRVIAGLITSVAVTAALHAQPTTSGAQASATTACPVVRVSQPRDTSGVSPDSARSPAQTSQATEGPTIVIYAAASAREVRFAAQPQISIRLCGAVTDSVRVIERRNLPDPVQPGATYRDVFIAVEIIGRLNAECLARRITGQPTRADDVCAAASIRDSSAAPPQRRPPS
jgi:hypothetical protein